MIPLDHRIKVESHKIAQYTAQLEDLEFQYNTLKEEFEGARAICERRMTSLMAEAEKKS